MWLTVWTALASLATLMAVLVALYRELIQAWWRRPLLNLKVVDPVDEKTARGFTVRYARLLVESNAGTKWRSRNAARNVQVLAVRLAPVPPGPQPEPIRQIPFRWTHDLEPYIPPGSARLLDLLFQDSMVNRLCLASEPQNPWWHLAPLGQYTVDVEVSADAVNAFWRRIEIDLRKGRAVLRLLDHPA
jgi:hypothetical protein